MDSFTDYYAILGVDVDAPTSAIKAAFKKLALQYHPDVYKGADAHERMSAILLAYQTLNDPAARKQYDLHRSEHLSGRRIQQAGGIQATTRRPHSATSEVSPSARRDRQRYYDFPDLQSDRPTRVDLIDIAYTLSHNEAHILREQGMLRGVAPETEGAKYYCHRCHHLWPIAPARRQGESQELPRSCPNCHATDWAEYLLLRCVHCCAIFESEQIRYEIGTYNYSTGNTSDLCPPYELFPLCPYCGTARWCPAEDTRVNELRLCAARHAAMLRVVWMSAIVVAVIFLGVIALVAMR
ncbi:MAG TPA: DnaJ domain-containing protein [Ktedonobacteraceae bacterium]|nr:DnaJ domain-containing protein [Ktedonobacteraceae bacterium]